MTLVEETNELAVATYDGHKSWTANIPGATWIWATDEVENPEADETYTFVETFEVENPTEASLVVAYDNWLKLYVNGDLVDDRTGTNGYQDFQKQTYNILGDLQPGENRIELEITNEGKDGEDYLSNPAGVLFHLSAKGDEDTCERTTKPEPDEMYLIDGFKYAGQSIQIDRLSILNGDNGLPDWTIELYDGEGDYITSTSTDDEGYYYFWVPEGEYEVREVIPSDWKQVAVDDNGQYVNTVNGPLTCVADLPLADEDYQYNNSVSVFYEGEEYNTSDYRCTFYNEQRPTIITTNDDDGGSGGDATRVAQRAAPQQLVAGAATSFCPFIKDHMQLGWENDWFEVTKLQMFLSMIMGYELEATGEFDQATDAAVKLFQARYSDEVLLPWVEQGIVANTEPTGFVYKLTRWKINDIVCPGFEPYPSFDGEDLNSNVDLD
jgi:hypothetical protein